MIGDGPFVGTLPLRFPQFDHLHLYEGLHGRTLNISFSNVKPFTLGEFRRALPRDLSLDWTDPDGSEELRRLIAKRHGVPADHVLVTVGATEANFLVNAALVGPGDRVVVDSPTYSPLRDCPRGFGATIVSVERGWRDGWPLDLDRLGRALRRRTRLLVLANLNNPTSAATPRDELREIADLSSERGTTVLVDETFREAAFEEAPPTAARLGAHMISISTVTKFYGLGALRVGWIVAEPELLRRLRGVKDYTTVGGSLLGQTLATWALRRHGFFARRARTILDRNREQAREALEGIPGLEGEVPSIGTVMFPRARVPVDKLSGLLLRRYGTVIAPGRFFGMKDHFRIGLGGDPADLGRGLKHLARAVSELT